jgi:hypothetical protein
VLLAFEAVEKHRAQIEYNHGQALEDLNARGGLDWYELYCGFTGRDLYPAVSVSEADARAFVVREVQAHALAASGNQAGLTVDRRAGQPSCTSPSARTSDTTPPKPRPAARGKAVARGKKVRHLTR